MQPPLLESLCQADMCICSAEKDNKIHILVEELAESQERLHKSVQEALEAGIVLLCICKFSVDCSKVPTHQDSLLICQSLQYCKGNTLL